MKTPITLESVTATFDHWRDTRPYRKQATPDTLREQAIKLLSHHKKAQVISALKISHSMLKQWQVQGNESIKHTPFVSLSPEVTESQSRSSLQIILCNPQGSEMRITGEVTPAQLHSLAKSFLNTPAHSA